MENYIQISLLYLIKLTICVQFQTQVPREHYYWAHIVGSMSENSCSYSQHQCTVIVLHVHIYVPYLCYKQPLCAVQENIHAGKVSCCQGPLRVKSITAFMGSTINYFSNATNTVK